MYYSHTQKILYVYQCIIIKYMYLKCVKLLHDVFEQ
jgi:hypothetical protein